MSKLFGSVAWMTAIAGIFVPVITIYAVWAAFLLAAIAALLGSRVLSILAILTALANLFVLSPVSLGLLGNNLFSLFTTGVLFVGTVASVVFSFKRAARQAEEKRAR
jgi:hypothetical protein